ncbi:MAG: multiheme c-type cytochrome [Myxococcota bacterium]|nr:multiheme c-type cytochrome [Myxococcota bacterium]
MFEQIEPVPPAVTQPVSGLNGLSAETCGACHSEVYTEWSSSMMADAFDDALFQAKWHSVEENFVCLHCHAPLQEQQPVKASGLEHIRPMVAAGDDNPLFDESLQHEGITCVACHLDEGHVVVSREGTVAPHPVVVQPEFGSDGGVCEGCHQLAEPVFYRLDRPLIDTVGEWERWQEITGRSETCVDCHMPVVQRKGGEASAASEGHSHVFPGARNLEMLQRGVAVLSVEKSSDGIDVVLENRAGHHFPTAEHAHSLVLSVAILDEQGGVISDSEHEMARHIENRREISDTTLRSGETRSFHSVFIQQQLARAVRARVGVHYRRMGLEPAIVEAAGLSESQRTVVVHLADFEI